MENTRTSGWEIRRSFSYLYSMFASYYLRRGVKKMLKEFSLRESIMENDKTFKPQVKLWDLLRSLKVLLNLNSRKEFFSKFFNSVVVACLQGTNRSAQDFRHLFIFHFFKIFHIEDKSLFFRQSQDCLL